MSQSNKITCPDCGAEMNHHAFKVDYGSDHSATLDPVYGATLKEAHACPRCGRIELRTAGKSKRH